MGSDGYELKLIVQKWAENGIFQFFELGSYILQGIKLLHLVLREVYGTLIRFLIMILNSSKEAITCSQTSGISLMFWKVSNFLKIFQWKFKKSIWSFLTSQMIIKSENELIFKNFDSWKFFMRSDIFRDICYFLQFFLFLAKKMLFWALMIVKWN